VAEFGGAGITPGAFITTDHRPGKVGRQISLTPFTLRLHFQHMASLIGGMAFGAQRQGKPRITHRTRHSFKCRRPAAMSSTPYTPLIKTVPRVDGLEAARDDSLYSVRSTTVAPGAFFCTDSMPLSALALVL
jgi:hypothetical protein